MLKIIGDGDGQMCNKLLFQAQVLSSSYKRNFDVVYHGFKKYEGIEYNEKAFGNTAILINEEYKYKKFLGYWLKFIKKIFKKNFGNMWYIEKKIEALDIEEKIKRDIFLKKNILWLGWPYMDYEALRSSVDEIRKFFRFKKEIICEANNFIDVSLYDIVLGVHMRRGDYKTWHNGKFYYSDEIYKRVVNEACRKFHGKKIAVVLFCNESVNEKSWSIDDVDVLISKNSAIVDLCLLSMCDYIIGPPSSFSGWASFIGNTKRFLFDTPEKNFNEEDCFVWLTETDGWGVKRKE